MNETQPSAISHWFVLFILFTREYYTESRTKDSSIDLQLMPMLMDFVIETQAIFNRFSYSFGCSCIPNLLFVFDG